MSGKPNNQETKIRAILEQKFEKAHVNAALNHFVESKRKYQEGDWEGSISKAGKFVEAVAKALLRSCGKSVPAARSFRAGPILDSLKNEPVSISDTIRIVIPKGCVFIYEIASNRGSRHDSDEVNPNEIDAGAVDVCLSWILGELIRFSSHRNKDPEEARELVKALTGKTFPFFEEIDGRFYINIDGLSAEKTGLLILYGYYPRRVKDDFLRELIERHGFSSKNSGMAFLRVKRLCDVDARGLKLRGLGRQKAEEVLNSVRTKPR